MAWSEPNIWNESTDGLRQSLPLNVFAQCGGDRSLEGPLPSDTEPTMSNNMSIAECIQDRSPSCFAPEDRVATAVSAMKESKLDSVLVCEGGKVVGIFTQRDFLNRVALPQKNDVPLSEVMTKSPDVLSRDESILTALKKMAAGNYRNIPVVDSEGNALGNLSVWDVMKFLRTQFHGEHAKLGTASIDALYQRPAVEVEHSDEVLSVLSLMMQRACGAVRVHKDGALVGIFAEQDLMHRVDYSGETWQSTRMSDVMTPEPFCIDGTTTIAQALDAMTEKGFRHLPVVQADLEENTRIVSVREVLGFVASQLS